MAFHILSGVVFTISGRAPLIAAYLSLVWLLFLGTVLSADHEHVYEDLH